MRLLRSGFRCMMTTYAIPLSAGTASMNRCSALSPPADAPIPTTASGSARGGALRGGVTGAVLMRRPSEIVAEERFISLVDQTVNTSYPILHEWSTSIARRAGERRGG
jgi:hypothetical protein